MTPNLLSERDLEIWHAFKQMGQFVMAALERDLAEATGLTGADFGVLSRLEKTLGELKVERRFTVAISGAY